MGNVDEDADMDDVVSTSQNGEHDATDQEEVLNLNLDLSTSLSNSLSQQEEQHNGSRMDMDDELDSFSTSARRVLVFEDKKDDDSQLVSSPSSLPLSLSKGPNEQHQQRVEGKEEERNDNHDDNTSNEVNQQQTLTLSSPSSPSPVTTSRNTERNTVSPSISPPPDSSLPSSSSFDAAVAVAAPSASPSLSISALLETVMYYESPATRRAPIQGIGEGGKTNNGDGGGGDHETTSASTTRGLFQEEPTPVTRNTTSITARAIALARESSTVLPIPYLDNSECDDDKNNDDHNKNPQQQQQEQRPEIFSSTTTTTASAGRIQGGSSDDLLQLLSNFDIDEYFSMDAEQDDADLQLLLDGGASLGSNHDISIGVNDTTITTTASVINATTTTGTTNSLGISLGASTIEQALALLHGGGEDLEDHIHDDDDDDHGDDNDSRKQMQQQQLEEEDNNNNHINNHSHSMEEDGFSTYTGDGASTIASRSSIATTNIELVEGMAQHAFDEVMSLLAGGGEGSGRGGGVDTNRHPGDDDEHDNDNFSHAGSFTSRTSSYGTNINQAIPTISWDEQSEGAVGSRDEDDHHNNSNNNRYVNADTVTSSKWDSLLRGELVDTSMIGDGGGETPRGQSSSSGSQSRFYNIRTQLGRSVFGEGLQERGDSGDALELQQKSSATTTNSIQWKNSLTRFTAAAVSTAATAANAVAPVWKDAVDLTESYRQTSSSKERIKNDRVCIDTEQQPLSMDATVNMIERVDNSYTSVHRLAAATLSTAVSAVRVSGPLVEDASDFTRHLLVDTQTIISKDRPTEELQQHQHPTRHHADASKEESFARLTSTVASTASSLVHATTPVLADAREFASDLAESLTNRPSDLSSTRKPLLDLRELEQPNDATFSPGLDAAVNRQDTHHGKVDDATKQSLLRFTAASASAAASAIQASGPAVVDARDLALDLMVRSYHEVRGGRTSSRSGESLVVQPPYNVAALRKEQRSRSTETSENIGSVSRPVLPSMRNLHAEPSWKQVGDMNSSWLRFKSAASSVFDKAAKVASTEVNDVASIVKAATSSSHTAEEGSDESILFDRELEGKGASEHSIGFAPIFGPLKESLDDSVVGDTLRSKVDGKLESGVFSNVSDALSRLSKPQGIHPSSTMDFPGITGTRNVESRLNICGNTRPPLASPTPRKFVDLIFMKPSSGTQTASAPGAEAPARSRALEEEYVSFDPNESIFAEIAEVVLSPPGSPPVPSIAAGNEDDDTLSCGTRDRSESPTELSFWDLPIQDPKLSPPLGSTRSGHDSVASLKPSSLPLSNEKDECGMDWGVASYHSVSSEKGLSGRSTGRGRWPADGSVSSKKRRVPRNRLTVTNRGTGRTLLLNRNEGQGRLSLLIPRQVTQSIHQSLSDIHQSLSDENPLTLTLDPKDDRLETISNVRSSPGISMEDENSNLRRKIMSSPNLHLLEAGDVSPVKSPSPFSPAYPRPILRTETTPNAAFPKGGGVLIEDPGMDEQRTLFLPLQEDALLEEALMKFSSVKKIDFSFVQDDSVATIGCEAHVALSWQQLVACWKHNEVSVSLRHAQASSCLTSSVDRNLSGSVMSADSTLSKPRSELGDVLLFGKSLQRSAADGENGSLSSLSSFVISLGKGASPEHEVLLQHRLPSQTVSAGCSALVELAQVNLKRFSALIADVTAEALNVDHDASSFDSGRGWYSSGVKCVESVTLKAKRKYSGDILQVKDVLRARIVFPDEGSLVAGLLQLKHRTTHALEDTSFSIVRLKNGFSTVGPILSMSPLSLPTGYRHILINIRLSCGLLAEIQFNLASLFDVLGEDGYRLHREISDFTHGEAVEEANHAFAIISRVVSQSSQLTCFTESSTVASSCAPNDLATPVHKNTSIPPGSMSSHTERGAGNKGNGDLAPPKLSNRNDSVVAGPLQQSHSVSQSVDGNPTSDGLASTETAKTVGQLSEQPLITPSSELESEKKELASEENCHTANEDFVLALLTHGAQTTAVNPRDIPTFLCLHGLLMYLLENDRFRNLPHIADESLRRRDGIVKHATRCLLRCLAISYQATSHGMTGWLEYGSSAPFNNAVERPFPLLHNLACCHACCNRWKDAEDVLQATVTWCEGQLNACHPLTLVTLLDLSATFSKVGRKDSARNILLLFCHRSSSLLSQLEQNCFENLNEQASDSRKRDPAFRVETGTGPLAILISFASYLQCLLQRKFSSVVGTSHPIMVFHRHFVGDAFAVLANCISCAESLHRVPAQHRQDTGFWRLAFAHYKKAFCGYSRIKHGNTSSSRHNDNSSCLYATAYGLARCLRELGEKERALRFLSTVLSDSSTPTHHNHEMVSARPRENAVVGPMMQNLSDSGPAASNCSHGDEDHSSSICFCYLSVNCHEAAAAEEQSSLFTKDVTLGICYWFMAALSLDCNPNSREGLSNAVHRLRTSSQFFHRALTRTLPSSSPTPVKMTSAAVYECCDDSEFAKSTCLRYLHMVEGEARLLFALREPPTGYPTFSSPYFSRPRFPATTVATTFCRLSSSQQQGTNASSTY